MKIKNRIIYIIGTSRSGSSILEKFLHENRVGSAKGELRWIFRRGIINNDLCGCGIRYKNCSHWSSVNINENDALKLDKGREYYDKFFNIFGFRKSNYQSYLDSLKNIYQNLLNEDQCIIDNSKSPLYYFLLRRISKKIDAELFVIHINRLPSDVVKSYSKKKVREESIEKEFMTTKTYWFTIIYWVAINLISKITRFSANHYIYLRYEDFCNNPELLLLNFEKSRSEYKDYHSLSGNPDRLSSEFELKELNIPDRSIKEKITNGILSFLY